MMNAESFKKVSSMIPAVMVMFKKIQTSCHVVQDLYLGYDYDWWLDSEYNWETGIYEKGHISSFV